MRKWFFQIAALIIGCSIQSNAQTVINGYAKIIEVSGNTLFVGATDESGDTFEAGDEIIIMQMQDSVLGTKTNTVGFGDVGSIASAGLYEIATIQSENIGAGPSTIWLEDFQDLTAGTTVDAGSTSWSRAGLSRGYAQVVDRLGNGNLVFEISDPGTPVTWTSGTIDISGAGSVAISMDAYEDGDCEVSDYIRAYYSIDGGANVQFGDANNDFTSTSFSVSGLRGSSLVITVTMLNSINIEDHSIDNILVQDESNAIILTNTLANTYNDCSNCVIQAITYPTLDDGSGNYTTTSDITALAWNGDIGGVIALMVQDTLTLEHDIIADELGFRGGNENNTTVGGACAPNAYIEYNLDYAEKGESIYKTLANLYMYGRGRIINGGGGGVYHNSGGGGGGNFTAGGAGGPGYLCTGVNEAPGLGGMDLSYFIAPNRIFMGGGGGGGQENDYTASAGASGGGIILIHANTIETTSCSGRIISASGGDALASGANDGAGGAGAGGSVVLDVSNWALSCSLGVTAAGGDGGDVSHVDSHGGGGGGGKGVLIFSTSVGSITNLSTSNTEGSGGNNSTTPGDVASPGEPSASNPAADADGVLESGSTPLPVELLYWKGNSDHGVNYLRWATAAEINNDFFTIEKSPDGYNWETFDIVEGRGNTTEVVYYDLIDDHPFNGRTYYRLSQTDFDGTTKILSKVILIKNELSEINVLLYPNPSDGNFAIQLDNGVSMEQVDVRILDMMGNVLTVNSVISGDKMEVQTRNLKPGTYIVQINNSIETFKGKLIIR